MGMVIVSIWNNWAEVNADGFEVGHGGPIPSTLEAYPKDPPPHAAPLANGNGIRFRFPDGALDTQAMTRWRWQIQTARGKDAKRLESKNNALGIGTSNAFAVAARALLEGGAKSKYGVGSPFVFITWTATDLATYCSKIMNAVLNGASDFGWVEIH
jgi:hypothetical protein